MNKKLLFFAGLLLAVFTVTAQNITLRSLLATPGETCAGVWGYVDSLGNEYALLGASKGLKIVNVTNPDSVFVVKVFPGPDNLWREIRTWKGFAYVTTEATSIQGLQIIDLRNLPDTSNMPVKYWSTMVNGSPLKTIHALEISNGFAYLYGSNVANGGAVIADLTDPWNPVYAGQYSSGGYIHDGYVRNDTMYAAHIYDGNVTIVNVLNKANPQVVAQQTTPTRFTHNTWLSDNSKYLFTTDENDNSYLACYDIRDKQNITELDRFQAFPGNNSIVHNVLIRNDFAVVSWYKDGVVIADAHRPQNLVLVGNYDTYAGTGPGFVGNWSVYPFLPSGNILATGINEGLFVLTPVYKRACYLEGVVKDSICNTPLHDVTVSINGTAVSEKTTTNGSYKTGYYQPGNYTVTFSKSGYQPRSVNVTLDTGVVHIVDLTLFSTGSKNLQGSTKQSQTSASVKSVFIDIMSGDDTLSLTSSNSGTFYSCGTFDQYSVIHAAKWGYKELCMDSVQLSAIPQLDLLLERGYKDDFHFDLGWTVTSAPSVTAGSWKRSVPNGFPSTDVTSDCSNKAFVTGNLSATEDLDGGYTKLTSPVMDLTIYDDPVISYSRFFNNGTGAPNDSMVVMISNGLITDTLEVLTATTAGWIGKSFRVKDYISLTQNVKLTFYVADILGDNRVEAAIDAFEVTGQIIESVKELSASQVVVFPNPNEGTFMIETGSDEKLTGIEMIDILGNRIIPEYTVQGSLVHIKVNAAAGTYIVRVQFQDHVKQSKLIIK